MAGHVCDVCSKIFTRASDLGRHSKQVHEQSRRCIDNNRYGISNNHVHISIVSIVHRSMKLIARTLLTDS